MRKLNIILFFTLLSCKQFGESKQQELSKAGNNEKIIQGISVTDSLKISEKKGSFLDSVFLKYELAIGQIKRHTNFDSVYYTGYHSDAFFSGDTLLQLRNGLKGAVIIYNDGRSCLSKLLFVFNSSQDISISSKVIYTDCDRDESSGCNYLRYVILSDSTFQTIETNLPPVSTKNQSSTKTVVKWKMMKRE